MKSFPVLLSQIMARLQQNRLLQKEVQCINVGKNCTDMKKMFNYEK